MLRAKCPNSHIGELKSVKTCPVILVKIRNYMKQKIKLKFS